MMDNLDNDAEVTRTKQMLYPALALVGMLALALLIIVIRQPKTEDTSASEPSAINTEAATEMQSAEDAPVADTPTPEVAEAYSATTVFDTSANAAHQAYYAPEGRCYVLFAKSTGQLLRAIEDDLGRRVEGHVAFDDGMIVHFQDGGKIAVWLRGIDCKDPPYDPYPQDTESSGAQ